MMTQGEERLGAGNDRSMSKVGNYKPNNYGLYDMHGNVSELCRDVWKVRLGSDTSTNPLVAEEGADYVVTKGGNWSVGANECRSAIRVPMPSGIRGSGSKHTVGFRVSCTGNLQK